MSIEAIRSAADRTHPELDLEHLIHPVTDHSLLPEARPLVLAEGVGCELIAEDGRRFIDGSSGLWTVNLGHRHPVLIEAATRQLSKLAYASTFGGMASIPTIELAERLTSIAPSGLSAVFFTSGGSEANETAIKLARRHWVRAGKPGKTIVIAHDRGYHGLAGVTTTATRLAPYHVDFGVHAPDIEEVPAPYPYRCVHGVPCEPADCPVCRAEIVDDRIRELGAERVAAVIVEPVFGSGGVIVPPHGYLSALRAVCTRNDVLMIADEVITGFGRTGRWFGVDAEGVSPDLLTFAKGVTSGYSPLGGVLVGDALWSELKDPAEAPGYLMHGFTHSGNPVGCAVALANIDTIESEELLGRVAEASRKLGELVRPLRDLPDVGEVRQAGLMVGVELVADKQTRQRWPAGLARGRSAVAAARDRGLLTRALLDDILCLAPPFTSSDALLERSVAILAESIEATDPQRHEAAP